ncbi:hypothetical protein SE17_01545 [Kouleothrix aurantiaca]|uniref:Uncharacterized protein n=1 Tax=Kouleothrix aurantiaca TaxID=186479 RepID=A0A0P9HIR1_9CHLR|nr:hypothetical protein SE17_01545 [Kouleothrix aurantiaca]
MMLPFSILLLLIGDSSVYHYSKVQWYSATENTKHTEFEIHSSVVSVVSVAQPLCLCYNRAVRLL